MTNIDADALTLAVIAQKSPDGLKRDELKTKSKMGKTKFKKALTAALDMGYLLNFRVNRFAFYFHHEHEANAKSLRQANADRVKAHAAESARLSEAAMGGVIAAFGDSLMLTIPQITKMTDGHKSTVGHIVRQMAIKGKLTKLTVSFKIVYYCENDKAEAATAAIKKLHPDFGKPEPETPKAEPFHPWPINPRMLNQPTWVMV